jgi:uncharacterized RDD family membrane protein YckC
MNTTNPYAPPQAAVQDIREPDTASEAAGRGTRLVAIILDGIITVALVYIPLAIGVATSGRPLMVNAHLNGAAIVGAGLWLALLGAVAWAWLTILFVSRNGQTIAKKLLGIKVVRSDGSKASLGRIFWLRNVVNAVLGIIPLYGFVDALLIFGEARQCVHDKIADTIVIKA